VRDAAWAVEDRVILGGGDLLRGLAGIVKWPFERIAWAVEQWVIWPLEERTGGWSPAMRAAGVALVATAAVGAGVAGLLWAAPDKGGDPAGSQAATPAAIATQPAPQPEAAAAGVLHGAAPVFKPEADSGTSKAADAQAVPATSAAAGSGTSKPAEVPPATTAPGGPAAMKVARQFADAFVLYETGQLSAGVRDALRETASPQLARSLLRRPPRLPANAAVPKAKVLNVVPGPRLGGIFTVSASLLRVGVTSELRIDLQRTKNGPKVTSVLG
jgi:hypothetical protein